ncbi:MAG: hypothetical protein IT437_03515 [Phycisphaerales bacterium]|nr:hypothetical protein [Phycisphaerales bacterium]
MQRWKSAVAALIIAPLAFAQDDSNHPGVRAWGECSVADCADGNTAPNTWGGGIVPYAFNGNVNPTNQQRAVDAMTAIEAVCGVDFVPRTNQAAYILFNAHPTSNNSCVGTNGGVCVVNIWEWWAPGVIMHELGHALGLWHEQQRADRDSYIQVNVANMCTTGAFNITGSTHDEYDFESVMHYQRIGASRDGSETITLLPAYTEWKYHLGHYEYLSNGDIYALTSLYPAPRPPKVFALQAPGHRVALGPAWMPDFAWGASAGADTYHLQVDDNPLFTTPEIDVVQAGNQYLHPQPLPAGRVFFWRVTSSNAVGDTAASPRPVRCFFTGVTPPAVVYVDDSAPPGGDGLSWSSPLTDLQDALAFTEIGQTQEVRVAQGLYRPDRGSGNRNLAFAAHNTMVLGGYAGFGAPNPGARDPGQYVTVLSGDLAGDDQPGFVNDTENSYHVVSLLATQCTLDGLTIRGGNADGPVRNGMGGGCTAGIASWP